MTAWLACRAIRGANLGALLIDDPRLVPQQLEAADDHRVTEVPMGQEFHPRELPPLVLRQPGRPRLQSHLSALEGDLLGHQVRPSADHQIACLQP